MRIARRVARRPLFHHRAAIAFVIVGALLEAHWAGAEGAIEAPKFNIGDKWRFVRVEPTTGKTFAWSREIIEIMPNGHLKVRFGDGTVSEYDAAMNYVDAAGRARVLAQYPMRLGDTWNATGPQHQVGYWIVDERIVGHVVTRETIDLSAGTYDCIRVDADVSFGVKSFTQQRIHSRWYCPAIKWFAKESIETREFNPSSTGYSRTFEQSELVLFTPGRLEH